jgi:hypothetical protein
MQGRVLLSTAYLPSAEYFFRISEAGSALIEREENFIKQTYRNRCYILASGGIQALTVPVCLGSFHKTPVKDLRIDYSRRWQQVHLGALMSAYRSSPYYLYYYEDIENTITKGHKFLLDLNMELLMLLLRMVKLETPVSYTGRFVHPGVDPDDFRYSLSPKKDSSYEPKKYRHVFDGSETHRGRLSIVDLIFNTGPATLEFLQEVTKGSWPENKQGRP